MQPSKKILAIILAAGNSERFNENKLFFEIDGIPVLQRTIENVLSIEKIDSILIVNSKKDELKIQKLLNQINSDKKIYSVYGGKNRAESLICATDFITDQKLNIDYLVVHDGARPFTKKNMFYQGIKNIEDYNFEAIINKYKTADGYGGNVYDMSSANKNGIIYPALDPSIFELKYPMTDIVGSVVGGETRGGY